jgi:hypothetical protein
MVCDEVEARWQGYSLSRNPPERMSARANQIVGAALEGRRYVVPSSGRLQV